MMNEFQGHKVAKKGIKRFITSPLACIVWLMLAFVLVKSLFGLYSKMLASAEARVASEKELHELIERKDFVEESIHYLKTEEGMEEEIRRKFNVVRPGESIVLVIDGPEAPQVEEEKGLWESFIGKAKAWYNGEN